MKKVLIPTKLNSIAREMLKNNGGYTVVQDDSQELIDLAKAHADTDVLIVRSEKVTAEIIDLLPKLKVVIRAGAGYNTIDTKYARRRGIDVMNTPGANANAVAEEVIALILADARHIVAADATTRAGAWEKKKYMGRELTGKTLGVVGLGAIGQLLIKRTRGFDVKILGYDPMISKDKAEKMGVELADMAQLFAESDYVSLHIPENEETRGLINTTLLSKMKNGATLVNCARAGIINEADLQQAINDKGIRFLNDVYPKDAAGEKSVAAFAHLMLPHLGANTMEANVNAAKRSAEQLIDYYEKGVTSYVVNRDIPEGLDEAYCELAFTLARFARALVGSKTQLKLIETSFYGDLKPFAPWLKVPIVAALNDDFDRSSDSKAAQRYLDEMGVEYENRETDDSKGFTNSITLDVTSSLDSENLRRTSIRGTVAEGALMVSRINDFDKLYFEPKGITAFFTYADRPGVLGRIGAALASADINIDDVRNPHDSSGKNSIAILKVNKVIPQDILDAVATDIDAHVAVCVTVD
ncbi:MAG: hypothetical protein EOL87_07040 [Spartobacteria bacterium]|nr:hypothetical protein [Spartobacteria bacterium]